MSVTGEALFRSATVIAVLAGWWKVFQKAGHPGWHALIPVYNLFVFLDVVDRPLWWLGVILLGPFLPGPFALIGMLAMITTSIALGFAAAERFGKDTGWALGLAFLPFLYYPALGFSDAEWNDPHYRDVPDRDPEPVGLFARRVPPAPPPPPMRSHDAPANTDRPRTPGRLRTLEPKGK